MFRKHKNESVFVCSQSFRAWISYNLDNQPVECLTKAVNDGNALLSLFHYDILIFSPRQVADSTRRKTFRPEDTGSREKDYDEDPHDRQCLSRIRVRQPFSLCVRYETQSHFAPTDSLKKSP